MTQKDRAETSTVVDTNSPAKSRSRRRRSRKHVRQQNKKQTLEKQSQATAPPPFTKDERTEDHTTIVYSSNTKKENATPKNKRKRSEIKQKVKRRPARKKRPVKVNGSNESQQKIVKKLIREATDRLFDAVDILQSTQELAHCGTLNVYIGLKNNEGTKTGKDTTQLEVSAAIYTQLMKQLRNQTPAAWRQGAVYCFQSESAIFPPDYDSVFVGYDGFGRPQWQGLLPLCARLEHPMIDRLFESPPRAISLLLKGPFDAELNETLSHKRPFSILGQVIIGPFNTRLLPPAEHDEKRVLSFQIAYAQTIDQPIKLRLNIIGFDLYDILEGAANGAPRGRLERLRRCIRQAQRRILKLESQARIGGLFYGQISVQSERILNWLLGTIEHIFSVEEQRTRHASQRHANMDRPTSEAWRDAVRAGDERRFYDVHTEAVVIVGPKGRAHLFNINAIHITSMRLGAGEVDRKQKQGKWRPLTIEEAHQFDRQLNQSIEARRQESRLIFTDSAYTPTLRIGDLASASQMSSMTQKSTNQQNDE